MLEKTDRGGDGHSQSKQSWYSWHSPVRLQAVDALLFNDFLL